MIKKLTNDVKVVHSLFPKIRDRSKFSIIFTKIFGKIFKTENTKTFENIERFEDKANNLIVKHHTSIDLNEEISNLKHKPISDKGTLDEIKNKIDILKGNMHVIQDLKDEDLNRHLGKKFKELDIIARSAESKYDELQVKTRAQEELEDPLDPKWQG